MLSSHLTIPMSVLWLLTSTYIANAAATLPRGWGPPIDFGRFAGDGRRILGDSKTWSGFLFGAFFAFPFGLLQAQLILWAPPNLALVPQFATTLAAAVPVVVLLTFGAMVGDSLGSFLKRRLGRPSGSRTLLLDQLPFVLVPVGLGAVLFPAVFAATFGNPEAILWLLAFTLGLHTLFNWIGYEAGWKKVPW